MQDYVQGIGCLPDPYDIVQMKKQSGHNWSCHEDATKFCAGFAAHATILYPELDLKEGGMISYEVWYNEGPEAAMAKALPRNQGETNVSGV